MSLRDENDRDEPAGIHPYDGPAGGWGALKAVATAIKREMGASGNSRALLGMNQPHGFDCPGCAWPDPDHTSSFEFCENGAKAVTWEATTKRVDPEFFARHTVTELLGWSDHDIEGAGRLTHPLRYDGKTDRFIPVEWDEAFAVIGKRLANYADPNEVEFYTSGRASNEAAFVYQLFARAYGTNNFPDCSNMCHEATSVGLPQSIGVGKGTVTLEDFDDADAVFCIGHNPGTNHPRMLTTLRACARRGAAIIVANPLRERGLERFVSPQHALEMLTDTPTQLASAYYQVKVGGDAAMLKGMMKALLAEDRRRLETGAPGLVDRKFIAEHTVGYDELEADLETTCWSAIERESGLDRKDIQAMARSYWEADRVIICYGMGVTQHRHGTENVQQIANLLMLRGNIGKKGAGICPLRGHSNVQGDRTVGITEIPGEAFLARLDETFGIRSPRAHGHNAVEAARAMVEGKARAFIGLGGNFATAMPDPQALYPAFRGLDLCVSMITKLNRTALLVGKESIVLPVLGRTEQDVQASGVQAVTVEDSMSMVHASRGILKPASENLRSEVSAIAAMARATMPKSPIDWEGMAGDYSRIRDAIERVFPDFRDFNARIAKPGGFRLRVGASLREWDTADGKAHFIAWPTALRDEDHGQDGDALMLATIRSHDQYNTTIYGMNDRYRGITGRRDVVFVNQADLDRLGLRQGDRVDVQAGQGRVLAGQVLVAHPIAPGSIAAYYPEANCLLGIADHDRNSGTPAYKSVPVRLLPARR